MAGYFDRTNLTGMAHWLRLQHQEELGHAQMPIDYLIDRNGVVEILPIPPQPVEFGTPAEAFRRVLEHEPFVTDAYRQAFELAWQARDYQTLVLIQDFLREQTEEIGKAQIIAGRMRGASLDPAAVLLLDQELGRRTAPEVAPQAD